MDTLFSIKNPSDDFVVEFDVISAPNIMQRVDSRQQQIAENLDYIDNQIAENQKKIDEINSDIDNLTSHADGIDYIIAVTCGIVTGMIDAVFIGKWNFKAAKAESNKKINEMVMQYAQDQGYTGDRLDGAVKFLEDKYPLPGDGTYRSVKDEIGINEHTHHLDDFCHHPTLIGLICCILVQFTGSTIYCNSDSEMVNLPLIVNNKGKFVGKNRITKLFSGVINWFFNTAQVLANRQGHIMSDAAGSSPSVKGGHDGMGLPGVFLSTLKELSALPCFKEIDFGENLRKAFQNGIGNGNKQLDLGVLNNLFKGASSKYDMRTEIAVKNELERQAIPVIINEALVRGIYFIRRLITELKVSRKLENISWKRVLPFDNRTIVRMMTIASGTFTVVDIANAAAYSTLDKRGKNMPVFLSNMILKVNFIGIGRFAVAISIDAFMGVERGQSRNERMRLNMKQLDLLNAKVFYKQADMWITAEDTGEVIKHSAVMMEQAIQYFKESMRERGVCTDEIGNCIPGIEKNNSGLKEDMLKILEE